MAVDVVEIDAVAKDVDGKIDLVFLDFPRNDDFLPISGLAIEEIVDEQGAARIRRVHQSHVPRAVLVTANETLALQLRRDLVPAAVIR